MTNACCSADARITGWSADVWLADWQVLGLLARRPMVAEPPSQSASAISLDNAHNIYIYIYKRGYEAWSDNFTNSLLTKRGGGGVQDYAYGVLCYIWW